MILNPKIQYKLKLALNIQDSWLFFSLYFLRDLRNKNIFSPQNINLPFIYCVCGVREEVRRAEGRYFFSNIKRDIIKNVIILSFISKNWKFVGKIYNLHVESKLSKVNCILAAFSGIF